MAGRFQECVSPPTIFVFWFGGYVLWVFGLLIDGVIRVVACVT